MARFKNPTGVAVSAASEVFVADEGNNASRWVLKMSALGWEPGFMTRDMDDNVYCRIRTATPQIT